MKLIRLLRPLQSLMAISMVLLFVSVLSSCNGLDIEPSNRVITIEKQLAPFTKISASHAVRVNVDFSDTLTNAVIKVNDNLVKHLKVEQVGDQLSIFMTDDLNIQGNATLEVTVSTSHISHYYISGSTNLTLANIQESKSPVIIFVSGAGEFSGTFNSPSLTTHLSGTSRVSLSGNVEDFTSTITGASYLSSSTLNANKANLSVSGASEAILTVSQELIANVTGASRLTYKGDGELVESEVSGASVINFMD